MSPEEIPRVQEALKVVAHFVNVGVETLTDEELDELSFAALTVGFGTSRRKSEEESQQDHENLMQYFALEASYQAGDEIAYASRRRTRAPARRQKRHVSPHRTWRRRQ